MVGAGVNIIVWDLQKSAHILRQPIAHQYAVPVKVLADQFKHF